jgi:tRNA-Thr(GGU) m(6)t(6)A37 methyltransferase TsaA
MVKKTLRNLFLPISPFFLFPFSPYKFAMGLILLAMLITCLVFVGAAAGETTPGAENKPAMSSSPALELHPIGIVHRQGDHTFIDLRPELASALKGLSGFSHVWVLYWFHENDRPEERAILQVHPRRNPANPLTGVFATRAPVRPNLIGFTCCRIISIKKNILEVEGLDAREGSPVLDLKPYIPGSDSIPEAQVPAWVKKPRGGD